MDNRRAYDYLCRSRAMLLDIVRTLAPEAYRAEHPIGLGSIARTLHHVRAAEYLYVRRLKGHTSPSPELAHEHDPDATTASALAFDELEPQWSEQAEDVRAALEAVDDWDQSRTYETTWNNEPYTYHASPNEFFAQLAFHEVHHRAQVLHMLRRAGKETPELDYNGLMWPNFGRE